MKGISCGPPCEYERQATLIHLFGMAYVYLSKKKGEKKERKKESNNIACKLEALGVRRPPWPRQIITPILPNVKMLSLGGERLTPKVLDHYLHHDLVMVLFAHLLILKYPDHHQNLISSSLYYPGPLHKISSQSVHNFLSNVVHRPTDKPMLPKT